MAKNNKNYHTVEELRDQALRNKFSSFSVGDDKSYHTVDEIRKAAIDQGFIKQPEPTVALPIVRNNQNKEQYKRVDLSTALNNARAPFANKQAIKNENDAAELAAQMLTNSSSYSDLSSSIERLQNIRGGAKRYDKNTDVYDKAIEKLQNIKDTAYKDGLKTTDEESAEQRYLQYEDNKKRMAQLGDKSSEEYKRLSEANKIYERDQKAVDETTVTSQRKDYKEKSANRDFKNPELTDTSSAGMVFDNIISIGHLIPTEQKNDKIPDKLGAYINQVTSEQKEAYDKIPFYHAGDALSSILFQGTSNAWDYLNDDEIDTYYYLYNSEGKEKAYEYLDGLTNTLQKRKQGKKDEEVEASEGLDLLIRNASTVPDNIVGGTLGFADNAINTMNGKSIKPYSPYQELANTSQKVREKTATDIDNATGNKAIPGVEFSFGDAYQAAMSGVDSTAGVATNPTFYAVAMGMGAARTKAQELYESGATDEQILADSLLTGTAEMLFEEISLDKIIKFAKNDTLKDVIVSSAIGAGIEGSEEVATDIANTINDIIVLGDEAELIKAYNQRLEEGYSENEAKGLAIADLGKQLGKSFLGGAIAGSGTGAAASYSKAKENVKTGIEDIAVGSQLNSKSNVNRLVDTALQMDNDVKNATELKALAQKIADKNYKASNRQIGKLERMVQDANLSEIQGSGATIAKQTIKAELQSQGVAENDLEKATNAIYKKEFSGESLTYAEEKAIKTKVAQAAIQNVRNQSEDIATKAQTRQERYLKNFAETQSLTQKEANPTVDIEDLDISDDGKTYIKDTNEAVDIKNIAKISKDDIVVTLSNGKTESIKNLDLGNEDTAIAYQSMLDMVKDSGIEVTPEVANTIVNLQNAAGIDNAAVYYKAATEVLENGWIGNTKYSLNTFAVELPENVRNEIYSLGRQLRQTYATNKTEALKNKKAPVKMGLTQLEGIPLRKLNVMQQSGVKVMQQFSKTTGLNITFFKSSKIDGKFVSRYGTANGFFDTDTNTIYIDVNAGLKGQGFILYTAAHELTHFIREWSPEHFKTFADFLVSEYNKNNVSVDELVREKQRTLRKELTYDQAYEEVIADSCESFLKDTDLIEKSAKLKNQDSTLWEKIKTYLSDLLDKVRALYSRFKPDSYEGKYVLTMKDSIQKIHEMWVNGATSAIESYNKAEKGNITGDKVKSTGIKLQERLENYPYNMQTVIQEYLDSVDNEVLEFAESVEKGNYTNKRLTVGNVDSREIKDIKNLLDIDIAGFKHTINTSGMEHIIERHGKNGKKDMSMKNNNDIARIKYIIKKYDKVEILTDQNGKQRFSKAFMSSDNTPAPMIRYSKKINGTYYVVESVPDSQYKRLWIQSAYIEKNTVTQASDENTPDTTSETNLASPVFSTNIISQTSENINSKMKNSERIDYDYGDLFESEDEELLTSHIAEELSGNDEGVATILKRQGDVDISDTKALKLAQKIIKQFGMPSSAASEITDTLLNVLDKAKDNTLTGSQTSKLINVIADEMSKGFYVDENVKSIYKDVINTYKGAIQLNEEQQRHIEEEGYTLSSINKELPYGMYFKKAQNGVKETVTSIFEDMSTEYPQYFSKEVYNNNSYSAATELVQVLKQLKEDTTALMGDTVSKEDIHEQATLAAAEMYADVVEAKQNVKSNQAISNIKKTLRESQRRKIKEAKAKAVDQKRKELLRQRERFNEKEKNIREEYREQRQRTTERRTRTEFRYQIRKLTDTFKQRLVKPSENKYVPRQLIAQTVDVLNAIDLDTGRSEAMTQQFALLRSQYDMLKDDAVSGAIYDETVSTMLRDLTTTIGDTPFMDMSTTQLKSIYNTLKALDTVIRNSVKMVNTDFKINAYQIGEKLIMETRAVPKTKGSLFSTWVQAGLRPQAMFNRLAGFVKNSYWSQLGEMLNNGQLRQTQLEMEFNQIFDKLVSDTKNLKTIFDTKNLIDIGLVNTEGEPVLITRGMMISLYMSLLDKDGARHVSGGGLTVPDMKLYYKGDYKLAYAKGFKSVNMQINEASDYILGLRGKIEEHLNDYDKQWIKAARYFFDVASKNALNDTTMQLYGFKKATIENYYPIHTDPDYRAAAWENIVRNMSLENVGIMKDRVKASNPILLEDITDVINNQISIVSKYCGLTIPIKNFQKAYGTTMIGFETSVQKELNKKFPSGKNSNGAIKYIDDLITDLTSGRQGKDSFLAKKLNQVRGNLAKATLTLNIPVSIAQAASYPTAAAEIGWKPLFKALAKGGEKSRVFSKAEKDIIAQISPLLWKRTQGYANVELGDLRNDKAAKHKIQTKFKQAISWIEFFDSMTVGRLFYACQYYIEDTLHLTRGTEEYNKALAKTYNDVIEKTQPNYTIMQRPEILRNPNAVVKSLTMFMTQRLQNFNIVYDAVGTYAKYRSDYLTGKNEVTKKDLKESGTRLRRAVTSQIAAATTIVSMKLIANALLHSLNGYRDDDKELTAEGVSWALLDAFADSLISSVLFGSELYSFFKAVAFKKSYHGITPNGVSSLSEALTNIVSLTQKGVSLDNLNYLAKSVCQVLGIPLNNVEKIALAIYNHINDATNGEFGSFESGVNRTNKQELNRAQKAYESGDTEKANKIFKDLYQAKLEDGKSQKDAKKAIRAMLTAKYKKEYTQAYLDHDTKTMNETRQYLYSTKMYDDLNALDKILNGWKKDANK